MPFTPEERREIDALCARIASMQKTLESVNDTLSQTHRFLFAPPTMGKPCRAERIDSILSAIAAGSFTGRTILYVGTAIVTLSAAWPALKSWWVGE